MPRLLPDGRTSFIRALSTVGQASLWVLFGCLPLTLPHESRQSTCLDGTVLKDRCPQQVQPM